MRVEKLGERVSVVHAETGTGPLYPTVMPSVRTQAGERFFAEIDNPLVTYDEAAVAARKNKTPEEAAKQTAVAVAELPGATAAESTTAVSEVAPAVAHTGEVAVAAVVATPDILALVESAQVGAHA